MKLFESNKQKAFFFIVIAIAFCVWVILSLWLMSHVHLEDDEVGWESILLAFPGVLFAYGVYCYLSEGKEGSSPIIWAIVTWVVFTAILSFLCLSLFDVYLINQFVYVIISTIICSVMFILVLDSIK